MNINEKSWIADGAKVLGDVTLGENVGVWYNAVIRGDCGPISIGKNSNVQDNSTVHTDLGFDVIVGENVTIGHNCIIHGCQIGDNTLIGMGSIIMNDAKIGKNCVIGAGSLVPGGTVIPDNSVAFGNPVKVRREVTDADVQASLKNAEHYVELMQANLK